MRATSRFNKRTGLWEKVVPRPTRPRLAIIGDSSEPFKSMADGQIYDSKSRYRADLKARGYVELGNDQPDVTVHEASDATGDLHQAFKEFE